MCQCFVSRIIPTFLDNTSPASTKGPFYNIIYVWKSHGTDSACFVPSLPFFWTAFRIFEAVSTHLTSRPERQSSCPFFFFFSEDTALSSARRCPLSLSARASLTSPWRTLNPLSVHSFNFGRTKLMLCFLKAYLDFVQSMENGVLLTNLHISNAPR